MKCKLVDVFTTQKLQGNGLCIFYDFAQLSTAEMLALTQEMRQFESIFLSNDANKFTAKIFTVEEELDFAGHPLIGLAYHLHEEFAQHEHHDWDVQLNSKLVRLSSSNKNGRLEASMLQGSPRFIKTLSAEQASVLYAALALPADQHAYPAEVISTGLAYVILPVRGGLETIQFTVADLSPLLECHGAKFLYVLDIDAFEGRTWDNCGKVEDIATGSAAGPTAAYLYKHQLLNSVQLSLHQGRFLNRPSQILVDLICQEGQIVDIKVSGHVVKVADMAFT